MTVTAQPRHRPDNWDADQAKQQLQEHIAELQTLRPALRAALAADHTPTVGTRVIVGGITLSTPVNTDVSRALAEVPYVGAYLFAQFQQALSTGDTRAARRIAADVDHWRRLTKQALGLLHYDRRLGQHCPQHDQPLTELVALGDEGWLIHDQHGYFVRWHQDRRIWCRHCGSLWDHRHMLLLGQLLKLAQQRRDQQIAE